MGEGQRDGERKGRKTDIRGEGQRGEEKEGKGRRTVISDE